LSEAEVIVMSEVEVALLTGGGDRPYAFGLATALLSKSLCVDLIGGDDLDSPEWHGTSQVNFLNLRGDQRPDASRSSKVSRVLRYYVRLIRYAATARPKIFHILWNNKFEVFDRVLLMYYYKLLRKKTVLTVHNVNVKKRDSNDTMLNRLTLKIQYRLADHLFVHTEKMKRELMEEFGVSASAITVIPFGINNAVPDTNLMSDEARRRLGIAEKDRVILFFGNIAPYKGLEYLVDAFQQVVTRSDNYRLIIAGNLKDCEMYWNDIQEMIKRDGNGGRILLKIRYIPDDETEVYFKAADLLVLPYRHIYQSGVLFLGYSFGLPVVATDVGALREEIIEGRTGFICTPEDSIDMARAIETYFSSDLYKDLNNRRQEIRKYALERHSWDVVGQLTGNVYAKLLRDRLSDEGSRVVSH
jgi:glycosyltransferase involved in cell wall biosynthesis